MQHKHLQAHNGNYAKLLVMTVLSFISMYILMYAMVDRLANVVPNINQFFMAGLMTMPMLMIELLLMGEMYKRKNLNRAIMTVSVFALAVFFVCIRQQSGVSDRQFLKSMIPHHAAAVLMCQRTKIEDAEIKTLCKNILSSQQKEIEQMKTMLQRVK